MGDCSNSAQELLAAGRAGKDAWQLRQVVEWFIASPSLQPICAQCSHREALHRYHSSGTLLGVTVLVTTHWHGGVGPPRVRTALDLGGQ